MATPKVDAKFIDTFIIAASETLKVQCSFDSTPGKAFLKGTQPEVQSTIAGVIGITSPTFKGSISICFPQNTFLKIMSGMLGEPCEVITKDLEDGAGELMNIIYGCAKKALNENGYNIDRAIPTVIKGSDWNIRPLSAIPVMVLPFSSAGGPFQIEIVIE